MTNVASEWSNRLLVAAGALVALAIAHPASAQDIDRVASAALSEVGLAGAQSKTGLSQSAEAAGSEGILVPTAAQAIVTASAAAVQTPPVQTDPPAKPEPFAFADFTWLNGNPRQKKPAFDSPLFALDFRVDANVTHSFNHPTDHTITGSAELARADELQLQQLGLGGDFHYHNVRARLMTQFGLFSQLTPRNDGSLGRGQWINTGDAHRYLAEAYGGYHIDKMNGINPTIARR